MKKFLSLLLSFIIAFSVLIPALTVDTSAAESDVRVFKMATSIQEGKKYVVVSSQYVGAAYAMTGTIYKETHLARTAVTIQHDTADDRYYVEIPSSRNNTIWTAESSGTSGYYYFKNNVDGTYLWAQSNTEDTSAEGTVSVGSLNESSDLFKWSYSGSGVYNAESFVYKSKTYYTGLRLSGNGYFRNAKAPVGEGSTVYLYEEASLDPYVHIRSKYQNIEENEILNNQALTKRNVCEYETESLFPLAVNFPDNADITYIWTSGNTSVATIDQNGLVTYTGNSGTTTITLTATSTDSDGNITTATSTTTITVLEEAIYSENTFVVTENFVAGESYLISPSASAGSSVILSNGKYTTSSEHYLTSSACSITDSSDGAYIECSDENNIWECIDSGTEGYFYLKNAATGKYLALVFDSTGTAKRIVTTASLGEYSEDAYLIKKDTTKGLLYSKLSYADESENNALKTKVSGSNTYFRLSTEPVKMYLYQRVDAESTIPTVQIRVSEFLGSKDITNVLQNRYNITANSTEQMLRYTTNILNITETVWSVSDESVATIDQDGLLTYTGKTGYVTITLTVTGEDKYGNTINQSVQTTLNVSTENYESPTENYPQYPHEGSVRINKTASNTAGGYNFQTSGVTEVELAVTGVPLNQSVDVVIVFDHSSSMNSGDKLKDAIKDTKEFALQIVNSNSRNRVAIVTFDRYRNNYNGFGDTTDDYTTNAASTEDRILTGDGTAANAFMTLDESDDLAARIDSLQYNATSGTNYDFGLQQCYDILKAAKSAPDANKKQYVVFMSDGQPFGFNKLYMYSQDPYSDAYDAWLLGQEDDATLAELLKDEETFPVVKYFNPNGENWFAEAIKAPEGSTVTGMPELEFYDGYHDGLGATMFTIGYDTGDLGSQTASILTTMASTDDKFYYAESNLQEAYNSILKTIVFAANEAVVTDKMGENFNLQFAPSFTLDNGMATITLDPAPCIEIGSYTLNSDGSRSTYKTVEKITFETNANGILTAAYSSLSGSTNIYDAASSKIIGKYVTYDILNETFEWNIGDITRNEVVLRYYAYLEGSAEGEREAGSYDTNEYAQIDYLNYISNKCQQTFPVPTMGWKQAAVNYEFYLVNANGEPVNKNGIVVPFSERVLIGQEQTKQILLNSSGDYSAYELVASEELPDGWVLFNENTSYEIAVSSGDNPSSAAINDSGKSVTTTYFRDGTITWTGNGDVPNVNDYTNTHVSFAVLFYDGIKPDSIVVDYGLPVKINALANDIGVSAGSISAIGTQLADGTELNNTAYTSSQLKDAASNLELENGTAKISDNEIIFTPTNLTMSGENVFYYEYLTDDGKYFYTTVTVIPAANIYYEESFFTFKDGNGYTWQTAGETLADKFQAEDRPGTFSFADCDANNVYGRDNAYNDSTTYSLGSARYASVDNKSFGKEPTAEFTFCGTGFDLFSVTNNDTGAVLVSIYKTDGKLYKNYIVQTYYGYSYEDDAYVPAPDNGGCLYQVPVISARELGYDTYKVVIKPLYSSVFDMQYDKTATVNSYDIYVDSVRIYDPAGITPAEDSVVGNAYLEDGEYAPEYMEIRRNVISAETFYSDILGTTSYGKGSVFIDGINSVDENGISDHYLDAGPNNELYLNKGQAIAFDIVSETPMTLAGIQLGMKVVYGDSAEVIIMNTNDMTPNKTVVSGAHEMYRRLNSAIIWDQTALETEGKYKTKYPIVIVNTSDSIVSLTGFKWAYTFAPENDEAALELAVYSDTPAMAYFAARRVLEDTESSEELEEVPYTNEDISIEWSDTTFTQGNEATLTVTTPYDIVAVTVDGIEITQCEIDEDGNKRWTYTFTVDQTGENTFDILLYDNEGNSSEPIKTESITVEKEKTIFDLILDFLKQLLTFFRRLMG